MIRTRRSVVLLTVVLTAIAAIAVFLWRQTSLVIDAPRPLLIHETADTLQGLPSSIIEAPVTYDLDTAIDSLEAAVPMTYGDLDRRIETEKNKNVSFAFLLHRSPFRVHVHGQTVTISADIEYSGRVWYNPPVGPEVEMSCGTGGDTPRRATLTLESTGQLTRDWRLLTSSHVVRLEAYSDSSRDRCRLTFMRIDVTDRVLGNTRAMLETTLTRFDEAVARWPVRPRFEKIWRDLQKPLLLADSVYMVINPTGAQVGSIGANGKTAFANLRLIASPRVLTGTRPQLELVPLPPLERAGDVGRGVIVLLDASFTYPVATAMLKRALVGRTLEQGGHRIRIHDVGISGLGGGKVALGIRLSGDIRGRLFFTGTPGFDLATRQITVPDLDYDVGSAEIVLRGYEWLNAVNLRDYLRERARLPDSAVVNRLTVLAEQGMNRELPARGTRLAGHINQAGVFAVRATMKDIRVRAQADADLRLSINRAPSIPRPAEPLAGGEGNDKQ